MLRNPFYNTFAAMNRPISPSPNRAVAWWLLTGAGMIMIQVLIGGITRLTESGLSITEWKPITGILPPIGDLAWQSEFDKYRQTDQFRHQSAFYHYPPNSALQSAQQKKNDQRNDHFLFEPLLP